MTDNIFQALINDHREAAQLMEKIERTGTDDADGRREMARDLAASLIAHNRAESEIFYAKLEGRLDTGKREEEHESVNRMTRELTGMKGDDAKWLEVFHEIRKNVEKHVDEEENEFFPKAREVLSSDESESMVERFEQAKSSVDTAT